MRFKIPQNTESVVWTNHSIDKMKQYQLSEQRVRRVLHTPKRKEEGIAPNTIAIMQSTGSIKHPTEIWVMIQEIKNGNSKTKNNFNKKIRIISTWRYPAVSPIRTVPNIPEEAWNALDGKDDIK